MIFRIKDVTFLSSPENFVTVPVWRRRPKAQKNPAWVDLDIKQKVYLFLLDSSNVDHVDTLKLVVIYFKEKQPQYSQSTHT
jgi:hypothetical protein